MLPIQIILSLLFGGFLVLTVFAVSAHKASRGAGFFWVCLWISGIFITWRPDYASRLADFLGVGRGVDAVMYVAFAILFYVVFRLLVRIEQLESHITTLATHIAIMGADNKK
jgi:hypothetical protein